MGVGLLGAPLHLVRADPGPAIHEYRPHNPALLLDFERFTSDALLGHYIAERDVIRAITPNIPITTNFMVQNHPAVADYAVWARQVDLLANDHYTWPATLSAMVSWRSAQTGCAGCPAVTPGFSSSTRPRP